MSATSNNFWSQGLLAAMNDPKLILESDDQLVIIKDKYPKAMFHFLVLPRRKIPSLKNVTKNDLDLLRYMHNKGEIFAKKANNELQFRLGYHAIPSMSHLHMHVISQDFNSSSLKTKKHWNSFNTDYFIDSADLIATIEREGHLEVNPTDMNTLLKQDLRCHVCKKSLTTIPALKDHIVLHDVTKKDKVG
ncbi:hypothetical protein Btru_034007 [Bulinus truncatus]|nr:hypothetical protein Btru_034007 [Bulinus truncatus]